MDFDAIFPDRRASGANTLQQCQQVMLRILKIVDYICTKHQINYFLIGGSLLGAIRHKGFIPWDDDLDIGMTRTDYEKFLRIGVPELPEDIFFQTPDTDPHYSHTTSVDARFRDKYSSYTHLNKPNNRWHEGLQVDIFVHDKAFIPHNFFMIGANRLLKELKNQHKRAKVLKWISKYVPLPLVYASNYQQHFNSYHAGTYLKPSECAKLVRTPFEDMEVLIPSGYHNYLTRQYGNYMQLPPEEKRVSNHDVKADPFTPCNHEQILHWEQRTCRKVIQP
jgi:phosphorylcholine metabolism protein LicD